MIDPKKEYSRGQPRILFFIHDGAGLGHLTRLSRLAKKLQGPCACLLVTGHRTAAAVVPPEVEFIHIPSMESMIKSKALYWGRPCFANMSGEMAMEFRMKLLRGIVDAWKPDVLVLDYLPVSKRSEMRDIVRDTPALKYFVLRGVIGTNEEQYKNLFTGDAGRALDEWYDRIVVAADQRICDVVEEFRFGEAKANKVSYVGYVGDEVTPEARAAARAARGLEPGDKWVVCSVGGGKDGEAIIEEGYRAGKALAARGVFVDVVVGPRSKLSRLVGERDADAAKDGRLRCHRECWDLPLYHASCDVVVGAGGYNTFVEALGGSAGYICHPIERFGDDEQAENGRRLSKFYPGRIIVRAHPSSGLEEDIQRLLNRPIDTEKTLGETDRLAFNGASRFRDLMWKDLGLPREAPVAPRE
jgi:predicted glycosyltransferase